MLHKRRISNQLGHSTVTLSINSFTSRPFVGAVSLFCDLGVFEFTANEMN